VSARGLGELDDTTIASGGIASLQIVHRNFHSSGLLGTLTVVSISNLLNWTLKNGIAHINEPVLSTNHGPRLIWPGVPDTSHELLLYCSLLLTPLGIIYVQLLVSLTKGGRLVAYALIDQFIEPIQRHAAQHPSVFARMV
jgi:hypothetical protein